MSASAAHAIIREQFGRGSREDLTACYFLSRGRTTAVIAILANAVWVLAA